MRFAPAIALVCLLAALALPGSAVAADTSPSCAEGPTTVEGTTYGTPCSDVIVAPASVEDVKGGGGDDTIVPAPITASTSCPSGCQLGVGSQTFEGGEGDDVVYGERGNDTLLGGGGNDQLFGGIGDDLLKGGPGNDRLVGGFGADSINGEEGDDYVRGDGTIDRIFDTGGGIDTLSYSTGITPGFGDSVSVPNFPPSGGERGLELDFGAGGENADNGVAPNGGGVDEVEVGAFEKIIGTAFSDHIVGGSPAETIYGGGGADALEGGNGDSLIGGADGDVCQGSGASTSACEGSIATRETGKVSVGFMTPPGATPYTQLYLVGSSGSDNITANYSSSAVTFQLTAGTFEAPSGGGCSVTATEATCSLSAPLDSVLIAGMNGADVIKAETFPISVGVVITGGEGSDTVTGGQESEDAIADGPGSGDDVLNALGRDDVLQHNGGADQLLGGDGNDLFLSDSICDGQTIQGGNGRNNASWTKFDEGVEVNLEAGLAGRLAAGSIPECGAEAVDVVQEVQDLEGSRFGDSFYGDGGANQLLGHLGGDSYFAGAGADLILANSGDSEPTDSDPVIDCGTDTDTAIIDFPPAVDGPPVNCEQVIEAAPNNFRTPTELPPPPLVEPPVEETPPVKKPPVVKPSRDKRPPQTRLAAHPPAVVYSHKKWRRVAFRFAANEAGSSFRCKLDGKPYRGCSSPRLYSVKAGRHTFRVFATDAAGNRDQTPALFRFRVRLR